MKIEGLTEQDLFEAILQAEDIPVYDPAIHLSPVVAAERWHTSKKAAYDILKKRPELEPIEVRSPENGKRFTAFRARK